MFFGHYRFNRVVAALTLAAALAACSHDSATFDERPPSREFLYFIYKSWSNFSPESAGGNLAWGGAIIGYKVDPASGALTRINHRPWMTGSRQSGRATAVRSGRFLYVANQDSVSGFSVNPEGGDLTALPGSPFHGTPGNEIRPTGPIVAHPSGKFLYVGNRRVVDLAGYDGAAVNGFRIDSTTGVLTMIAGSPFPAYGFGNVDLAIPPSGKFLFAANALGMRGGSGTGQSGVTVLSIDRSTGALKALQQDSTPVGHGASELAFDRSGRFLYVNAGGDGWIEGFQISNGGALMPLTGSPFASARAHSLSADPLGDFLYTTNDNPHWTSGAEEEVVSGYSIDKGSGVLKPVPGSPFVVNGAAPRDITVDRFGRFAYFTGRVDNHVSQFIIDSTTGALRPGPDWPARSRSEVGPGGMYGDTAPLAIVGVR